MLLVSCYMPVIEFFLDGPVNILLAGDLTCACFFDF